MIKNNRFVLHKTMKFAYPYDDNELELSGTKPQKYKLPDEMSGKITIYTSKEGYQKAVDIHEQILEEKSYIVSKVVICDGLNDRKIENDIIDGCFGSEYNENMKLIENTDILFPDKCINGVESCYQLLTRVKKAVGEMDEYAIIVAHKYVIDVLVNSRDKKPLGLHSVCAQNVPIDLGNL